MLKFFVYQVFPVVYCCFSAERAAGGLVVEHHYAFCANIWKS